MKNSTQLTAAMIFIASAFVFPTRFFAQAGSLDLSFDTDGIVTADIGQDEDNGRAIAIQADGKIVVAGYSYFNDRDVFALLRYNLNGSLDDSFDDDGVVTTPIGDSGNRAHALAMQSDGKIVVAGYYWNGSNNDFAVARYNADGSLDNSFDTDGIATTSFEEFSNDRAFAVAIQADEKIVVGGYYTNPEGPVNREFAVVRYNANGSIDNTFDGDGKAITAIEVSGDEAHSVIIQDDGKIVAGGFSFDSSVRKFAIVRYNVDGSLDNTFDEDGIASTSITNYDDAAYAVAQQSDGKLVLTGYTSGDSYDFATVRYNTDGSLDNSFDADGIVITSIGTTATSADTPNAVLIDGDGKILVGGFVGNNQSDFGLVRYNTDGSVDNSFGNQGIVTTQIGANGSDAVIHGMAFQIDNKIVVAGYSLNGSENDFALARYNYSSNVGLNAELIQKSNVVVYPNPNNGTFFLKNISENSLISLYDSMGRMVLMQNVNSMREIVLPKECSKGVYLIRVFDDQKFMEGSLVFINN